VQEAYRGLLMTGRYPVAFLFLEVPPDRVDVNVHPTKAEVRFRDKDSIYQLIHRAVCCRLQATDLTARLQLKTGKDPRPDMEGDLRSPPSAGPTPPATPTQGPTTLTTPPEQMPSATRSTMPRTPAPAEEKSLPLPAPAELFPPSASHGHLAAAPVPHDLGSEPGAPSRPPRALQVLDCYLVVEEPPDEVLFIDQHALHERILFEQLQSRLRSGRLEAQRLLIPETVELPASQAALVLGQREALAELGLEVEGFGGGTLLLSSYPALLGRQSPRAVLRAVVDYVLAKERVPGREQFLNDLLSLMACHAAVRAGDRLSPEAIRELLVLRELAENSHHCPHGRPTSLRFSRHDLERHFKRV
jgi:DNA mismatch repair protein MutL